MNKQRSEVVVITGATAGVGRAVAHRFAKERAKVALLARDQGRLDATVAEIEELGGKAMALPVDVADASRVETAADIVEREFGPIDVWVNNAMTSVFAEFYEIEPEEYRRVTDVVYHGQVYGTMAALKRMLPRDRGSIVLVGSALAYRGIPLQSAYCGAKHAIQGMFDSLRAELKHRKSNVRLTMVQLPAVNTPQFSWVRNKLPNKAQPVPPIFEPEVPAQAIYWAAHHNRREVYVGAPTVETIVGNKVAPGLGDSYLAENGYQSQMIDEKEDPNRPDNLFTPVPGDHGVRGKFSDRARSSSWQLWMSLNRAWLAPMAAGTAVAAGALLRSAFKSR